ncbi:MFS general substrate transporter [Lichtheimia hyalospora FSU 10163]|nr:MFS general substrate transporter [Lichtheimia hyalospora FSU 10163]
MATIEKEQVEVTTTVIDAEKGVKANGLVQEEEYEPLTPQEMRRLRWRLDLRIIPFCGLLYLCSFLDRSNIGNAKIAGITDDLNITESEYNVALSIFFIGYIIFEIPSNLMLKRVGPNAWIPLVMISFGIVLACMSAVKNGSGLLATRFFLGIAEAGLFPGVIFYITLWYTRREQATRIAIFFGWATVAGAFGGVLAYGIMRMDGLRGLRGWQWIFLIESIPTMVLACLTYFVLPGLPETSKILTPRERHAIIQRLQDDFGAKSESTHFSWKQFRAGCTDWKVLAHSLVYICGSIPLYSLSLFLPSIIKGMGFQDLEAQAMSAPPYAIACVATILIAMHADKVGERAFHIAVPSFVGMIGYILLITLKDKGAVALYISACITTTGVFGHASTMLSWFANNFSGHVKRAVASAIIISIGNVGGALGGQVYRANDAPQYIRAHSACAALMFVQIIIILVYKYLLIRINRKRDNMTPEEYRKACEGDELCDLHPDFRYIT